MIENTLFLKIGGGLVAVGGTAGAGYYAHTQGLFSQTETYENETEKNYLIVKSTAQKDNMADGSIYDYGLFSQQKNFKCSANAVNSKVTTYEDCEIYKLSNKEKELATKITNNFGATSKNIKEEGNYFKITSTQLIKDINKWESDSQQISILKSNDESKIFGKLIPIYKVENGKIVARKTSFLYAKVKDTVGTTITQPNTTIDINNKDYQCKFKETTFPCSITDLTVTNKSVTEKTTPALTKTDLIVKDKQFQIEMTEEYLNLFTFKEGEKVEETINVIPKTTSATDQFFAKLTPLFKKLDHTIEGKDSFLLLASTTETGTTAATTGYKTCKIGAENKTVPCEIYKFATPQESSGTVNFSTNPTITESGADIQANKFFVIKLSNSVVNFNDLKQDSTIKLITSAAGTDNKEFSFSVKNRLFINPVPNSTTLNIESVHVLDI